MKYHRRLFNLTLVLLISVITLANMPNTPISLEAASPMPTSINTNDATDSEVNQYYQGVEGLSGDALLAGLYDIIDDHHEYDYDDNTHRFIYKIIDRNWQLSPLSESELAAFNYDSDNPYIRKLYADYNDDIATADRFRNPNASRVSFDKEHIWAQSLGGFGRDGGAGSDFHSLLPSDVKGNQQAHSNYNFAVPTSSRNEVLNDKGTTVGWNGYIDGASQKVFEPLDAYKGDIARAMFYMSARYYEYVDVLHPKLVLVDGSPSALTATPTQPGLAGDLTTLLDWHLLDPVDDYEIHRNNLIYHNYQGNRNPFIDHPEWAEIIFDETYTGEGASLAPGSSSVGDVPVVVRLSRIEVTSGASATPLYLFGQVDPAQFIVTAYYSDGSSKVVDDYQILIDDQPVGMLTAFGDVELTFSYEEDGVTRTNLYIVNVELSIMHYIGIAGIAVMIIIALVLFPKLRKRVVKKTKKHYKKRR